MYKAVKNKDYTQYKSTGGNNMLVPKQCDYSVYCDGIHILDIKDHLIDPKGVCNGIVKILNNQSKIKLNLNV